MQVLQMGMQKQLQQYTEQIATDRERRDELEQRLALFKLAKKKLAGDVLENA